MFPFDPPENIWKPLVFWYFPKDQKGTLGRKGLTKKIFKDTHREKAPSNKIPALTKTINMDIWVVGTLNQLYITSSYAEKIIIKIK